MSEKQTTQELNKKIKDLLDWLEDKHGDVASIWGMDDTLSIAEDQETLKKIFTEEQLRFITILVKNVINALEFHNTDKLAESHMDIREDIQHIEAKLRNHRHPLNETYSARPEF